VEGQFDFMLTLKTAFQSTRKKCRPKRPHTSAWAMRGSRVNNSSVWMLGSFGGCFTPALCRNTTQ